MELIHLLLIVALILIIVGYPEGILYLASGCLIGLVLTNIFK